MATLTGEQLKNSYQSIVTVNDTISSDPTSGQLENGKGTPLTAVGIGTNSPTDTLNISSASNQIGLDTGDQTTYGTLDVGHFTNGAFIGTQAGSNTVSDLIRLGTSGTERMKIHSSGDISFRDTSANEAFYWDASAGSLGIGTDSPLSILHVNGADAIMRLSDTNGGTSFIGHDSTGAFWRTFTTDTHRFQRASGTESMRIDSSGNVGIGTTSPSEKLAVQSAFTTSASDVFLEINSGHQASGGSDVTGEAGILFKQGASGDVLRNAGAIISGREGNYSVDSVADSYLAFETAINGTNTEAMRIDSSGNVLVGKTTSNTSGAGTEIYGGGNAGIVALTSNGRPLYLNRLSTDGDIIEFDKDGTTVGSIGSSAGNSIFVGSGDVGVRFSDTNDAIYPMTTGGINRDNATDLGVAGSRFKDLYLGGEVYANGFYQNGSVTDNLVISQGTGTSRPSVGLWGNDHASFPGQIHIVSNSSNAGADSGEIRFYDYTGSAFQINMTIDKSGNVDVAGALSKGSGSFKIDHPLESKKDTHYLVHSFVESPQANNIYRGSVNLVDGQATVNLDEVSGMTDGTFVLLNTDIHVYTSNESDWDAVKGSVSDSVLTIECQNASSTAKVNWLVIGERHDQHMIETDWTDENGKVIVEPLKAQ